MCIVAAVKLVEILMKKVRSKLSEVSLLVDEEECTCRGRLKINTSRSWVNVIGKVCTYKDHLKDDAFFLH